MYSYGLSTASVSSLKSITSGRIIVYPSSVTFQARAGESDRLYGSITSANIAEALEEQVGQEVDRRKIDLEEPLKQLGTHAVTIRLAPQAEAKVTVVVEREE